MKALLVVHDYLPEHVGGSEVHCHLLARGLIGLGHEVVVACTERDLSRAEGSVRERDLEGVRVLEMIHQREYADVRETWTQAPAARVFAELLERERPDVTHFQHFATWGVECLELARRAGVRTLVTQHDYHLVCDDGFLLRPDGQRCSAETGGDGWGCDACLRRHPKRADEAWETLARERRAFHSRVLEPEPVVLCPSRFLADTLVACGLLRPEQVELLDRHAHGPLREARRSDPGQPLRVVYVGGLYSAKGVHVLVDAVESIEDGSVELAIHGVLEWFPEYVQDLRRGAGAARVRFCGRFDPADVDDVLGQADLLVVPSLWVENMPMVIQDAYRNGLPVVASDIGGLAEAVEHGVSGLLFPPGDAPSLARTLRLLAADREHLYRLALGCPRPRPFQALSRRVAQLYGESRR